MSTAAVDQQISAKPYPAYKDSGLPWIDRIPAHWDVLPNRAVMKSRKDVVGKSADKHTLLSLTKRGVIPRDLDNPEGKFPASFESYQEVQPNDLVFCLFDIDETPRAVGLATSAGMITGAYNRFECLVAESAPFILYYYLSLDDGKRLKPLYTGLRKVIKQPVFLSAKMPFPPLPEQRAIVCFLNSKLAELDQFVARKLRFIELLNEQRSVIINRAVTRGIDPNAKLKPSGIEWLGRIPEHWDVRRLKFLATIKYGLGQPPKEKAGGLPLIRATNIMRGKVTDVGMVFVDPLEIPWGRDPILREDDIVVVRSGAYTADSAIIPKHYDGAIIGYDMVVRAAGIHPRFLALALLSHYVVKHQLYLEKMRAAQPHLNAEELGDTLVVFPNNPEQDRIAHYIERETRGIEEAIAKAEREIELTNEYRTALISDVVTGKIDVRGVDCGNFGVNSEPFTEDTDV